MEFWQKMVFPVRRFWIAVASRVKAPNHGALLPGIYTYSLIGTSLLKLHDDIQTCGYEDVQVMWQMLRSSDTEVGPPKRRNRSFWRVFVWSSHSTASTK